MNLTLVTLNVFNNPDSRAAEREPLIVGELERLDPAIVCLQEVDLDAAQVQRWAEALDYRAFHLPNPGAAGGIKSLAMLARLPVEALDVLELPRDDRALRLHLDGVDVDDYGVCFGDSSDDDPALYPSDHRGLMTRLTLP